jgi:type II secretory ATPase GspE/PulE/Tfp pilus assembly ATPase PilB-like protein
MDSQLGQLLHKCTDPTEMAMALKANGWQSWLDDGFEKVLAGESSLDELARVAGLL